MVILPKDVPLDPWGNEYSYQKPEKWAALYAEVFWKRR